MLTGGLMKIIISKLPPTINHIYAFRSIRGHATSYITKEGKEWFEFAGLELKKQWKKKTPIEAPCEIWIELYLAYDRDIDNSNKPILDLLQKNGVIKNDSLFYKMDVEKFKCKKEEARIELEIMGY